MYPYIVCNCGFSLGDKYDAFKALKAKAYEEYFVRTGKYIDPDNIVYAEDAHVDLRDALEQLGITMQCCKARMLTQIEYKSIY